MEMADDGYVLRLRTVQGSAFRNLIEALKDILNDANLIFDENGMTILAMDSTHTVMVHVRLYSANFEYYHNSKKLILGVNMSQFFKLTKSMSNCETLELYVEKDKENALGILITDSDKNSSTRYVLKLMDLDYNEYTIPDIEFDYVITMLSLDFQKHIRDMTQLAEILEIRSTKKNMTFNCDGEFASRETIIGETTNGLMFKSGQDNNTIVQGKFSLKYLLMFTRCTNLSTNIEMYLKNDYPLIIKYAVANLGEIKLCLSPRIDTEV